MTELSAEPSVVAIDALKKQVALLPSGETAEGITKKAIEALGGMGLVTKDKTVKLSVLGALGGFNAIEPTDGNVHESLRLKAVAVDMATAIGVESQDDEVIAASVDALAKIFQSSDLRGANHRAAVLGIGGVAINTNDNIRNLAMGKLSEYQQQPNKSRGYIGYTTDPDAQKLASSVVAVLGL